MSKTKPYFHDRLILLILSINTFLALALVITALLPLSDPNAGFIREYRSNLGLDGYRAGDIKDIVSFAVFAVIIYAFQIYTSMKVYHIHKRLSMVILLLTLIALIFGLLACNALLSLR